MTPLMTRAQRERQKRKKLIQLDHNRQRVKQRLDTYWEEKRRQKEALTVKEVECFEKWNATHGLSASDFSPEEWEKKFLNVSHSQSAVYESVSITFTGLDGYIHSVMSCHLSCIYKLFV